MARYSCLTPCRGHPRRARVEVVAAFADRYGTRTELCSARSWEGSYPNDGLQQDMSSTSNAGGIFVSFFSFSFDRGPHCNPSRFLYS